MSGPYTACSGLVGLSEAANMADSASVGQISCSFITEILHSGGKLIRPREWRAIKVNSYFFILSAL